jgi:PAS domain S-box-containing protein
MALAFVVITFIKYLGSMQDATFPGNSKWIGWGLVMGDMLVVAVILHAAIGARQRLELRHAQLHETNQRLAARETHIAHQNEKLQAQTEEFERQSEALSVANGELALREERLRHLLELSRSLTAQLSRDQMLARICETAARLLTGAGVAAAMVERQADRAVVLCHYGFGAGGLIADSFPYELSVQALVLAREHIGYLEDVALRPELRMTQPRTGEPVRSVLAAPLRVRGQSVGTLEVYSRARRSWTGNEVSLIQSLAAQASASLENAQLIAEIDEQRRRFETIFRTLPIGVAVADVETGAMRLNAAGAALFNTSPELKLEDYKKWGWQIVRDERPLELRETMMKRALDRGEETRGDEMDVVLTDGRRLSLLVSAAPVRDRRGLIVTAVGVFVDITAQKTLNHELDARRRDAEEASIRKTRFLAAVSHDIRTPANAINLLAELMRRAASTPSLAADVPDMAQELQSSARSLVELVSDVLDLTRFDARRVELQESEFSLGSLLQEQHRQLVALAQAKGLKFEIAPLAQPIDLCADRVKLARILANLIGNAVKFTESGFVRIGAARAAAGDVRIDVTDTGIGIAAENQERIFDEFFQIRNPSRDRTKGTGLGLSICKRIVEAMSGKLEVHSDSGRGSSFTVTLPRSCVIGAGAVRGGAPPHPGDDPSSEIAAEPATSSRLHGLRVLLVEDHDTTRRTTAQILGAEGAIVTEAADGRSGLRLVYEAQPQVLLLDMMLPDLDGAEILRALHTQRPPGLRSVLVLTGDLTEQRGQEVRQLGADAMIHKPIDLDALISRMQQSVT